MRHVKLTHRQAAVLSYIRSTARLRGRPPSLREIARHFGIASTNGVGCHLLALRRKRVLTWKVDDSRTLQPAITLPFGGDVG